MTSRELKLDIPKTFYVTLQLPLTNDLLMGALTTAVEGGINYWAMVSNVTRDEEDWVTSVVVRDAEDEDEPAYTVTLETIAVGIGRILNGDLVNDTIYGYILDAVRGDDGGCIDADAADCIVQVGIFGKLTYS